MLFTAQCMKECLIERVVTVAGENAISAGNFIVKVGTPFSDILHIVLVSMKYSRSMN